MTLPGAEVMNVGFMGEDIFLSILGFEDLVSPLPLRLEAAILYLSGPFMSG